MIDLEDAPNEGSKDKDDVLALGRARLEQAITVLTPTRDLELEDLKFSAGSSDNNYQWDEGVLAARVSDEDARPTLTINKLPQHIKQVTNDA